MAPVTIVIFFACVAISSVQATGKKQMEERVHVQALMPTKGKVQRPLCTGHVQDSHLHLFYEQEHQHCPTLERFEAWEEQIEKSFCEPRPVMVELKPEGNYTYLPSTVQVKRCTGFCQYSVCTPTETKKRLVQVVRSGQGTNKTACGVVEVEEHVACECRCNLNNWECNNWQVFYAAECRCVCRNGWARSRDCAKGFWDEQACGCVCAREECPRRHEWVAHQCRCVRVLE